MFFSSCWVRWLIHFSGRVPLFFFEPSKWAHSLCNKLVVSYAFLFLFVETSATLFAYFPMGVRVALLQFIANLLTKVNMDWEYDESTEN